MYPSIPKYIGWPIVWALLIVCTLLISPGHISWAWEIFIIAVLLIAVCISVIYFWRTKSSINYPTIKFPSPLEVFRAHRRIGRIHKAQAKKIHSNIMSLIIELETAKDGLSTDIGWQNTPTIRGVLNKMQMELNDLGYLVKNSEYDRWAEQMMHYQSHTLHFHMKDDDMYTEWGRALRDFVNRVRG